MFEEPRVLISTANSTETGRLQSRIRNCGYHCVAVARGHPETERLLVQHAPDVLVLDVQRLDEPTIARTHRILQHSHHLPVIVITRDQQGVTRFSHAAGGHLGVLLEPFDDRLLSAVIENALLRARHERETALERRHRDWAEARLAEVLAWSPDAIISVDLTQRIRVFNRAALDMFGWSATELFGQPLSVLLPEPFERHAEMVAEFASSSVAVGRMMGERREVSGRRKSGEVFPAEVSISKIGSGDDVLLTAIVRDATERKKLEAATASAQQLEVVGRLAASVVHDFNGVLSAVACVAQLLRLDGEPSPYVESIELAVERGSALTDQLLSFVRNEPSRLVPVRPGFIVKRMVRLLEGLAPGVELHIALDEECVVLGNRVRLEQLVLNLVTNARDAEASRLHIEVELAEDVEYQLDPGPGLVVMAGPASREAQLRLRVSDDGTGIDGAVIDRIFEPFFTTKPLGRGTGLGLATVAKIVEEHAGRVVVRARDGGGTHFDVYLPCPAELQGRPS